MSRENNRISQVLSIINGWKLNKELLASKAGISPYTFKMKIAGKDSRYKFTDADLDKVEAALKELATDIENACGISFNKALATVARQKVD